MQLTFVAVATALIAAQAASAFGSCSDAQVHLSTSVLFNSLAMDANWRFFFYL